MSTSRLPYSSDDSTGFDLVASAAASRTVSSPSSLPAARMQLYERYAHLVASEYEAREAGRRDVAEQLGAERAEVHASWQALADASHAAHAAEAAAAPTTFSTVLEEADAELSHRAEVDAALRERLSTLELATARMYEGRVPRSVRSASGPRRGLPLPDATASPGGALDRRF